MLEKSMKVTHERLVLGKFGALIENEHLARYRFAAEMTEGKTVADIACGTGYGTQMLAKRGASSVLGMDLSKEAVAFALDHYDAANATYSVGDAQQLTALQDSQFDLVVSFETIEHLPDVEAYLDEMARIIRPGGDFLVSTPDRRIASVMYRFLGRPQNKYHVREYTERDLLELLSTRFHIKACYGQAFVPRWLVFWPVQFAIKTFCRMMATTAARDFKEKIYSDSGNVEVRPKESTPGVPKFWVIACVCPEK
jgi:ubiquinone/menaquinone biosynthesis C-methylase UbiE